MIIGVVGCLLGLTAWELYWRSQGFTADLDDDDNLWAIHRARVEEATEDDVILIGSSRVYFDLQLDEWEQETGKRPIQLAIEGTSPLYAFDDLVNNSDFKGTIVVGVTESLFFSTVFPEAPPNEKINKRIKYYKDRTYADRLNNSLSIPIQNSFAFVSDVSGVDGIKLKSLLDEIKIGERVPDPMPPFHVFSSVDESRNLRMTERTATDTAFAGTIKKVWMFFRNAGGDFEPEKEATTEFFVENVKKFRDRGGKVVLIRCPSTGDVRGFEKKVFPRKEYWDQLVEKSDVPAYHFEDYQKLKDYDCPEWSHLSAEDADNFTEAFVDLLFRDGHISKSDRIDQLTNN
ncbi:hypothetical protein C8P64_0608 [Christiangramia gaetbulicola]|uniref:Uncharacterized protein n=1 Tax=Christiangramia gaetbulicola TaxID=703340 RepID=A0A2T6ALJ0_9FLAO|nr:hypothetical protein C8P64_0608 [Christiangramia gaetbulicola]